MKEFNSTGEIVIRTENITDPGSPVNKDFVSTEITNSKRSIQIPSSENLNNLVENGRYHAISSTVTSNPASNFPPGALHGYLDVVVISTNYISQKWTDTYAGFEAKRRLYNGTWTPWVRDVDAAMSGKADKTYVDDSLEELSERIDMTTGPVVVPPETEVVYGDYRPTYWTRSSGFDTYHHGPSGTSFIPADYVGDGLVGKMGRSTGYSEMVVTKHGHNLRVSCINPTTSRHVTYTIEGSYSGVLSYRDDFHIVRDIYVGAVVNNVPSMDTQIMGRSNMEWAFQIKLNGQSEFVPFHVTVNTYYQAPVVYKDSTSGVVINPNSMTTGNRIEGVGGLTIVQSVRVEHSNAPGETIVLVDQVTSISPDGLVQSETVFRSVKDFIIDLNYAPMTPVEMGVVNRFTTASGVVYDLDSVAPQTTYYTEVDEGRDFTTGIFTGDSVFAAVALLTPTSTWGKEDALPLSDTPLRIETRASPAQFKLYPSRVVRDSTVPAGLVWRMGAQWRYGEL